MARLEFMFQEIDDEIDAISKVASDFIAPSSVHVFPQLKTSLEGIRGSPNGRPYSWGIPEQSPLYTITSWGAYEPDGKGEHPIFATITSVWDIEPIGPYNTKSRPHRRFALAGIASTKVHLYIGSPEERQQELAMWRMEVGDDASPGCHFHVQVLGESDDPPFPHSLPVPRFPGLIMTPMAVLEFVLAELFQDEWRMHAAQETPNMKRWQPIQRKRFRDLLSWKMERATTLVGSPWTALKWEKPPANLFLRQYP